MLIMPGWMGSLLRPVLIQLISQNIKSAERHLGRQIRRRNLAWAQLRQTPKLQRQNQKSAVHKRHDRLHPL